MVKTYKGALSASLRGQVFPCLLLYSRISLLSFKGTQVCDREFAPAFFLSRKALSSSSSSFLSFLGA